jgi:hypothetical protein
MTAIVVGPGAIDHGDLEGLEDHDHLQYPLAIGEIKKIAGPLTQAQYSTISIPDVDTLYVIVN